MIYLNDKTSFQQNRLTSILDSGLQQEITLEYSCKNEICSLYKNQPLCNLLHIIQNIQIPTHSFYSDAFLSSH